MGIMSQTPGLSWLICDRWRTLYPFCSRYLAVSTVLRLVDVHTVRGLGSPLSSRRLVFARCWRRHLVIFSAYSSPCLDSDASPLYEKSIEMPAYWHVSMGMLSNEEWMNCRPVQNMYVSISRGDSTGKRRCDSTGTRNCDCWWSFVPRRWSAGTDR